jgi:hypothetical protein
MSESPTKGFTATNRESGQSGAMRPKASSAWVLNVWEGIVEALECMVVVRIRVGVKVG